MVQPMDVLIGFGALYSKDKIINAGFETRGLEALEKRMTNNWNHEIKRRFSGDIGKLKLYERSYEEIVHAPDFYDIVPLRANASDAVGDMMMTAGLELCIVTSHSSKYKSEIVKKLERLERDFPDVPAILIPDKVHTGRGRAVGMHDRRILKNGFFITSDTSAAQGMPSGCTYLMLEEAACGSDLPLVSFDDNSPNYWGHILSPKATRKITDQVSGDTSTIMKNSSIEG